MYTHCKLWSSTTTRKLTLWKTVKTVWKRFIGPCWLLIAVNTFVNSDSDLFSSHMRTKQKEAALLLCYFVVKLLKGGGTAVWRNRHSHRCHSWNDLSSIFLGDKFDHPVLLWEQMIGPVKQRQVIYLKNRVKNGHIVQCLPGWIENRWIRKSETPFSFFSGWQNETLKKLPLELHG